ncbi:MAG: RsmD family RNA methyltransferase, partial [Planctomycetota bacterium]
MRIIAGEHRGRRLVGPTDDRTTRPITDRVKEALFARLTAMGLFGDFEAGAVADVFCGTGSLGLEALSRGARRCVFVDRDRSALDGLRENLEVLGEVARG